MLKKFLYCFLFLQFSFVIAQQPKRVLLPKKVYEVYEAGRSLSHEYFYDGTKLKRIDFYSVMGLQRSLEFTYTKNLITNIKYIEKDSEAQIKYFYDPTAKLKKELRIYSRFDSMVTTYKHPAKNEAITKEYRPVYNSLWERKLSYENGNRTREFIGQNQLISRIYDSKPNPHTNITGFGSRINIVEISYWSDSRNNITEELNKGYGDVLQLFRNIYTYNNDGYPERIEYQVRQGCIDCKPITYFYEFEYMEYMPQKE
jgi:hypothetical protein